MLPVLIFSKDRACQLHLLLESLARNAPDIFNVAVLYNFSNPEFEQGYDLLIERSIYPASIIQDDNNLYPYIQDWFFNHAITISDKLLFMVDDQICTAPIDKHDLEVIDKVFERPNLLCHSLRLDAHKWKGDGGMNRHTNFIPTLIHDQQEDFIYWDSKDFNFYFPGCNYAYPMSLDGNIYAADFIHNFFSTMMFSSNPDTAGIAMKTPNDFESKLNMIYQLSVDKELYTEMTAFIEARMVNSPSNRVQNTHQNGYGEQYPYTAEELNKKYLAGQVIDYDLLDLSNTFYAPHVELQFLFSEYK